MVTPTEWLNIEYFEKLLVLWIHLPSEFVHWKEENNDAFNIIVLEWINWILIVLHNIHLNNNEGIIFRMFYAYTYV